jgi:hypothetical protein
MWVLTNVYVWVVVITMWASVYVWLESDQIFLWTATTTRSKNTYTYIYSAIFFNDLLTFRAWSYVGQLTRSLHTSTRSVFPQYWEATTLGQSSAPSNLERTKTSFIGWCIILKPSAAGIRPWLLSVPCRQVRAHHSYNTTLQKFSFGFTVRRKNVLDLNNGKRQVNGSKLGRHSITDFYFAFCIFEFASQERL